MSIQNICPGVDFFLTRLNTHTYPRHWHEEFAIGLVHEGCGVNMVDRRLIDYPSQSIILINPRQIHTGFSAGQLDLYYSMFYILPDFINEKNHNSPIKPYFPIPIINSSLIQKKIAAVFNEIVNTRGVTKKDVLKALIYIIRMLKENHLLKIEPVGPPSRESKIDHAYRFIQNHFKEEINVEQIARHVNLSRAYFSRAFRKRFGISPHECILQYRLHHAKGQLQKGQPIINTALESGFYDQSHLTHWLKKTFYLTPKEI